MTTLVCDATKRWQRMRGEEVYFLTGSDENGLKVMEADGGWLRSLVWWLSGLGGSRTMLKHGAIRSLPVCHCSEDVFLI